MKRFARFLPVSPAVDHADHPIDEEAGSAHLGGLLEQETVRLLQFLAEHLARGIDDLHSPLPLERWEIPAQLRGIAHHLLRRDLEEHDKAGLVELACPAIDELDPHGGLACPDGPFNQSDVASRDAPFQDRIQTADPGTREIFGRRHEIHCLGLIRHWDFRHAVGGGGTAMRHLAPSPVGLRALE